MGVKAKVLRQMMIQCLTPLVIIDPRVEGVVVPEESYGDLPLGLGVGAHGVDAVRGVKIGENDLQFTANFAGDPFRVVVPWDAVFGMFDGMKGGGKVWPEYVPEELKEKFVGFEEESEPDDEPDTKEVIRRFGLIQGDRKGARETTGAPQSNEAPSLRLVT